eukprot:9919302-Alexandrium_andersonii.AAC.1
MCIRDSPWTPGGAPAGLFRRQVRHLHENIGTEFAPRELRGAVFRPLMGPHSSSFERLKQFRML